MVPAHLREVTYLAKRTKISEVCKNVALSIVSYNMKSGLELDTLKLKSIRSLQSPCVLPPLTNVSLLWHMYGLRLDADLHRPNWCGYMQSISIGEHASVSDVHILPIYGLEVNRPVMYLHNFAVSTRSGKEVEHCVTFDQPLYIKAKDISSAANLDFVCRLGGFHKPMNFLGAIGNLMKGSGLQEMLGLLYGPNTLEHIMSGKAYALSIRGHFIIHDALVQMLLLTVMDEGFKEQKCESEDPTSGLCADDVYGVVNQLYRQCWNDRILVEDCSNIKSQHLSNTACKLQAGLGFCRQKPVSATHEV